MNILFLYGNEKTLALADWLEKQHHHVVCCSSKIQSIHEIMDSVDLVVSFSYRYLILRSMIEEAKGNVVNLHISYLPWNRGADPNMWSWIDDTPKGVTIHFVSETLDTGDIIAQRITQMDQTDTLRSSYDKLMADIEQLFKDVFPLFPHWNEMRKKALGKGSYHRAAELNELRERLNYTMTIREFLKEECALHKEST